TYPSQQYDTLSKTNRKTFKATIFVTNGWDIQNNVGVELIPTNADSKLFNLKISEDQTGKPYFLLGPTFPQFASNWATKIVVEGELKADTPPGTYTIGINPIAPPKELSEKWSKEHNGIYVPYGFLSPSGNYIDLIITVEP
ncbi:MAG: hypothetical protein AABX02_03700, partial [archaeon]